MVLTKESSLFCEHASEVSRRFIGSSPDRISFLGGGYYGRVYLCESGDRYAVVKLYLRPGMHECEARQLRLIKSHCPERVPEVYYTCDSPSESLCMEYLPGINAGHLEKLPPTREKLCEDITSALAALHSVRGEGFGELENPVYSEWGSFYKPIAAETLQKAISLDRAGRLAPEVVRTMNRAFDCFDSLFSEPVSYPALVHGDYNTWNILLKPDFSGIAAVIDPFNCRWSDPEYDLYQLGNANGKQFGLLESYAKKRPLSQHFAAKNAFYELFTEIAHYYDANVLPNAPLVEKEREALSSELFLK